MHKGAGVPWFAVLLLLAGCGPTLRQTEPRDLAPPEKPAQKVDLDATTQLELRAGECGGIGGGPKTEYKLVLRKGGPCYGTVIKGNNVNDLNQEVTRYELPAEEFERCRTLLLEVDFLKMTSAQPQFLFENSCSSLTVRCDRGQHCVLVVHPARPPVGFYRVWRFAADLPGRGKIIKPDAPGKTGEEDKPLPSK